MTIRFKSSLGTFLLRDPEVIETSRGPVFRAPYRMEAPDGYLYPELHRGDFRLRDCVLCEPVPEQLEMAEAA